jgi:nicotinate-nucleotide pyrophosphorylase (carboxylating)
MDDLDRFLAEDLGRRGDVTTRALFGRKGPLAKARLFPRQPIVVAGAREAADVFDRLGATAVGRAKDGTKIAAGRSILEVQGPIGAILTGERLALNLLGRMSGIATLTRRLVEAVHKVNPSCRVAATRKTTPGFRAFEKRAVVLGGADPHRMGLYDGILIKDNHLEALGDVTQAIERAKRARTGLAIEVEVSSVRAARDAVRAGADWILVDNLSPAMARRVAAQARQERRSIKIEVSGGLTEKNLTSYAPFADRLSLGLLTHSAPSADVTLELVAPKH